MPKVSILEPAQEASDPFRDRKNSRRYPTTRHSLIAFAILPVLIGATRCGSCDPKPFATALIAVWRAGGNSILFLNPNAGGKSVNVDFTYQDYPPTSTTDGSFFTKARFDAALGGADVTSFKLYCGNIEANRELKTTVVFWSSDYWEGTKQTFLCGGGAASTFEIDSAINAAKSACLFTEVSPANRQNRCLNGPRCDDERKNQGESDVDCGNVSGCSKCGHGHTCNGNADCVGNTCVGGICQQPTCTDTIKNQAETDVDCGASGCPKCGLNKRCSNASNCASGYCQGGLCKPKPTCNGSPSTGSATSFVVYARASNRCAGAFTYFANSLNDAKGCAQNNGLTPVSQLCSFLMNLTYPSGDVDNWHPGVVAASASDAVQCANQTICGSGCSATVNTSGNCVSQP